VPITQTVSESEALLPSFASRRRGVDCFVHLPYFLARSGERFFFGALTIISRVELGVGRDDGCCKIWTTRRQPVSVMSMLVGMINLNKAKSAVWPSLCFESSC
jgi:hypothetical protein